MELNKCPDCKDAVEIIIEEYAEHDYENTYEIYCDSDGNICTQDEALEIYMRVEYYLCYTGFNPYKIIIGFLLRRKLNETSKRHIEGKEQ